MNGFELASFLNIKYPEIMIVFISSYSKYAIEGYKFKAFRFLEKESITQNLISVLDDLNNELNKENKIILTYKDYTYCIDVKDIIYCISEGHYLNMETINKLYRIRVDMRLVKDAFIREGLIEVYKGILINYKFVENISLNERLVYLLNGKKIHGSKQGLRKLIGKLNEAY